MEVIFVDWAPIDQKSKIRSGGQIRRYYAWMTLNKTVNTVVPFRRMDGSINWQAAIKMFKRDSMIWVEYGCGGVAHFFVLLASFIRFKKRLTLDVHDFTVEQQRDTYREHPFLKRLRLHIVERLLLRRANTLILPWPRTLDYFTPKRNQKVLIMPPGVGADELSIGSPRNNVNKKIETLLYFGSMRRKGILPTIIEIFSKLAGCELLLVGQKEGAKIEERENVRYLGVVSHDKLQTIFNDVDAILISLPKYKYIDKTMQIRLGYALNSCKPVIATKLKGISEYMSLVGLEENVIYVEEWDIDSMKDALQKAQSLDINAEKTIEKLMYMTWEPRFKRAVEIAVSISEKNQGKIEWV